MNDVAIQVDGLWKRYNIHPVHTLLGKGRRVWERMTGRRPRQEEFWALRDVSLQVRRGEALGVIGANGAGKSTLLKVLAGVTAPTRGTAQVQGRVAPFIELGAGFHPDLTGRENVLINGVILGMSLREVKERYDSIVEFSGLHDFMDTPVKKYSSGMFLRLGFSVAVHTEPDVLLVDEVLAVGDLEFRLRCYNWLTDFRARGKTLVFVSHNEGMVAKHCSSVLVLTRGEQRFLGSPGEAFDHYHGEVGKLGAAAVGLYGHRDDTAHIGSVVLRDHAGHEATRFAFGHDLCVDVTYDSPTPIEDAILCFRIEDAAGTTVFGATMAHAGKTISIVPGGSSTRLRIPELPLACGVYFLTVAINDRHEQNIAYANRAASFRVDGPRADNRQLAGPVYVKHEWEALA